MPLTPSSVFALQLPDSFLPENSVGKKYKILTLKKVPRNFYKFSYQPFWQQVNSATFPLGSINVLNFEIRVPEQLLLSTVPLNTTAHGGQHFKPHPLLVVLCPLLQT